MHPVACRLAEDAAADREAAADGMRRGALERGAQLRFGRVEPEVVPSAKVQRTVAPGSTSMMALKPAPEALNTISSAWRSPPGRWDKGREVAEPDAARELTRYQ